MSQRIAVFLPNWIGDAVMATPALRAIRTTYPGARITAIARPVIGGVLEGLDLVDDQIVADKGWHGQGLNGWALVRELRRRRFELGVLFPNSLRTAWLARVGGMRRRIGMNRDGRGWLLTTALTPTSRTTPNPVIDEYARIAIAAGAEHCGRKMELATTENDRQRWRQYCSGQSGLRPDALVCLNPGGAFGAAKHWPTESFAALARRIAQRGNESVVVLCGPAEREQAAAICRQADHPQVFGLHSTAPSVGLTKAAIEHARLLVSTDSGPRHFAAPFGVPVITLFGPTHIAWSETYDPRAVHLQEPVDCGPCQQRVCPLGHHDCMRNLSVDRVFSTVESVLSSRWPKTSKVA